MKTLAIASLAAVAVADPFQFVLYNDGGCDGPVADQRMDRPVGSCTSKSSFLEVHNKNELPKPCLGFFYFFLQGDRDANADSYIDFEGEGLYGGLILDVYNNRPGCTFKFWENADCHGKATVQHSSIYCSAIANKNGQLYLTNGAKSASISC